MKTDKDKFDAQIESLQNTIWAMAADRLPEIRRIADGGEEALKDINDDDRRLIIGAFCLLASTLLKKKIEAEKLEEH